MINPNFSESQLQQLVNTEITMQLYSHNKGIYLPKIVSLIKEYKLGWDTAFYFPWLLAPPNDHHKGCNFFIQYKLSRLIEGHRAEEWKYWHSPYFKFQIPYSTKDKTNNQSFDDYHQFDRLKELADLGYYVYYATNHIVYESELFNIAANQRLINEIPFLDVSNINGHHKKVTFNRNSLYFLLHSEPKEIKMLNWKKFISIIKGSEGTSLSKDVEVLKKFIFRLEEKTEISQEGGFFKEIMKFADWPIQEKTLGEAMIISKYLRRTLDLYWYKS